MNHTPGPWESRPVADARIIAIAQVGMMYPHAYITTPTDAPAPLNDEAIANAALIKAAPALLAALENAANVIRLALANGAWRNKSSDERDSADEVRDRLADADEAIAQAKGEAS